MDTVARGGLEHTDRAVAAARAAHEGGQWRLTPPAQRAAVLDAIADQLTERINDLAVLEALENGAPVRQAGAFQIGFSIAALRYFARQARREPVGVCGAIVAWNFPLLLAMWKIGPALAAGVLNVVPGEGPVAGARLASHPDVRKIAVTGSTAVGREIMRMAAGNVKRLTLEPGGKGPNVVLDDADLDLAADGTLFGGLMNQGQACESGTRIIVAATGHDKFVERLIERARTISIGDPLDMATDQRALQVADQLEAGTVWVNDWHMVNAAYPFGGYKERAGPRAGPARPRRVHRGEVRAPRPVRPAGPPGRRAVAQHATGLRCRHRGPFGQNIQ